MKVPAPITDRDEAANGTQEHDDGAVAENTRELRAAAGLDRKILMPMRLDITSLTGKYVQGVTDFMHSDLTGCRTSAFSRGDTNFRVDEAQEGLVQLRTCTTKCGGELANEFVSGSYSPNLKLNV